MIVSMSLVQAVALWTGRAIVSSLVLISQPSMILTSLSCPSACSFLSEIISFLGIMSSCDRGLANVLMASGIALTTLEGVSPISGATPMKSSMKISIFPVSTAGTGTVMSRALAKGMYCARVILVSRFVEMVSKMVW
jgi:hypothetical protein